jgi:hypothetical protein
MKVEDLFEEFDYLNAEAELDMEKNLEKAYEEIRNIHLAITKNDFGILIDKKGKKLNYNDIQRIKRELQMIFRNNPFFQRRIRNQSDFQLSARRMAHRIESVVLGVFSGIFALSSVLTGPIGLAIGAGSFALARRSHTLGKAIDTSASVLNVAHAFQDLNKVEPGRKERIKDIIKKKDPKELERLVRNDARSVGKDFAKKFEKAVRKMPSHITYYDKDGEEQLFPIEQLFE